MTGRDPDEALLRVALGQEPPDTIVAEATVFDAFSAEFLPDRSVWIKDGRVARVARAGERVHGQPQLIDGRGLTLVPGLIDGHSHVVRLFIPEFVRAVLPTGVTSVVIEAMEYGVTDGFRALRPFIDALRDQPLRLFYTAPTLCGLTEEEEVAPLTEAEMGELLADPSCLGLGETYWNNALLPGPQGRRVRALVRQTLAAGKVVEGHSAGAKGARLDAYTALGVSSCHEPISVEEALEVYRRGLFLMIREGGIRRELRQLRPLFDMPLDFHRFALVTDSMDPERLATWGYLDAVVREALELGIAPALVYRMASTNVAEHFRLDHRLGSIAPGRFADLVAIPSPEEFRPRFVMVGGRLVADQGRGLVEPRPAVVAPEFLGTVKIDPRTARGVAQPPPLPLGPVRAIELVTNLVTRERVMAPEEATGADVVPVLALERTRGGKSFWGLLKGYGLREGAYATTMSWDSPDMLIAGRDAASILTAVGRLSENGGGCVYARAEEIVAECAAPVCAIASLEPAERVRADLRRLVTALHEGGVGWEDPILAVATLTTPAIPHLRLTHRGYVRVRDRALLPREV